MDYRTRFDNRKLRRRDFQFSLARQMVPPVLREEVERPLAAYKQGEAYRDRGSG